MVQIVTPEGEWNNFHTHTYRCRHAEGDIPEYAKRAADLGMTKLGISEHAFVRGVDHSQRLAERDVPEYVELCRQTDGKYGNVRVFCGVECDYDPSDESFFREYYLGEWNMDYLIGSVHEWKNRKEEMNCFSGRHFGAKALRIYTDLYIKMMESRIFTFCAHPDLFCSPIDIAEDPAGWDVNAESAGRQILEAAEATGSILEINVSGVWKMKNRGYASVPYPRRQFWEMASDYEIPVIVNTDAHSLERLEACVDYGMDLVRQYHLRRVELG